MAQTDSFYAKEDSLVELAKGRGTMRVIIGHKQLRGEPKTYLDVRVWYPDNEGVLCPGKGFAKPLTKEEIGRIGQALLDYAGKED